MSRAARKIARGSVALAVVVTVVMCSQTLRAQTATLLMFYGGTLKTPVQLTGADAAAFNNVTTPTNITVAEMGTRAYVPVALFWGPRADPANNRSKVTDLKPEMAWQHGRFYPAVTGKPAVLLTTHFDKRQQPIPVPSNGAAFVWGGPVSPEALAILKRVGVTR